MPKSDFVMMQELGKGSFASVLKCKRKTDNKEYAMKLVKMDKLKQKDRVNALNQIRLLASISDPYIISYKQAFYDQQTQNLCIVMEYANEGDLQSKIKKHAKAKTNFKEVQIWQTAFHLLKGCKKLHQSKIIHRDIKSANIFFSNGIAKLGDMNVSKIMKTNFATTQTGTPYYASPQVWSDQPYGPKSDIWSIGIVLYQMCCFIPPFRAADFEGLYKKIMNGQYQKIPSLYSKALGELIARFLIVDHKKRPNVEQLLQNSIFLDFQLKEQDIIYEAEVQMLQTIQMPKNYKLLNQRLPSPKYDESAVRKEKPKKTVVFEENNKQKINSSSKLPSLSHNKSQNKIPLYPLSSKLLPSCGSQLDLNKVGSQMDLNKVTIRKIASNKGIKVCKAPLKTKNGLNEWCG